MSDLPNFAEPTCWVDVPDSETALQFEDFNFYFDTKKWGRSETKQALQNIHLKIAAKKVTAVIGASGCGKSTLLRAINRIYEVSKPDKDNPAAGRAEGNIWFDGQDVFSNQTDVTSLRQKIGMVFQKPVPFPMSIFDNVAYGIRINFSYSKSEVADRVEDYLKQACLWDEVKDRLNKSGAALSGGQQQRLCIARTLGSEPVILLLDEPCSALDPIASGEVENTIEALKEKLTIVIVTHNMEQAARTSDNTVFMQGYEEKDGRKVLTPGRIIEVGPTREFFINPRRHETSKYLRVST